MSNKIYLDFSSSSAASRSFKNSQCDLVVEREGTQPYGYRVVSYRVDTTARNHWEYLPKAVSEVQQKMQIRKQNAKIIRK